ncbi:cell cycle checkpoint control protein RAD9A-like isoform X2 [Gigantopelta aegis]|uniref:cell cycle checkpoint control protein RAD9A-like isoform X2 n=1 Tax=Gigantopelta aegis TaxID=1735272 RepID=UPI001B889644|nr:cell cycle checkpoint control protein RAD9A-like isoform X2 [Gigantopelta aegis]
MKCVIPGINVKVFGRAIHSFSRIGEELYIEPLEQGLALRTVNSSRSAFACCIFAPSFFQHYNDGSGKINTQESEEEGFRCKLAMKSILSVFRSMSSIEKSVERVKITLNNDESRLVFQLYCKHGIVKTHNLAFIECETLEAVFSKDMSPNLLTAPPKLLCDVVVNFQNNQEEITLIVKPDKISLKNYVEDEPDPTKVVHTEMTLVPEEFDNYRVGVDTDITFCLKELRAILAFAETTNLPLSMHFETAGRPIVFSIDSDATFEANFVLATLADLDSQSSSQQPVQDKVKKSSKNKGEDRLTSTQDGQNGYRNSSQQKRQTVKCNDGHPAETGHLETRGDNPAYDEMLDEDMNIDEQTMMHLNAVEAESEMVRGDGHQSPPASRSSSDSALSQVIPLQSTNIAKCDLESSVAADESVMQDVHEEEELVPGTPPSKKFRSMFFGLSQSSTQMSQVSQKPKTVVLAEDTDDDD